VYQKLQSLINRHSVNFASGDISAILPLYAPVLPVYIAGNRVTLEGLDEVAASLESHYASVKDLGFELIGGKLSALSVPRNGRFRAIVDWRYAHQSGFGGPTGRTTYFCRMEADGPIIEMMEYPRLAFESASYWYADRLSPERLTGT